MWLSMPTPPFPPSAFFQVLTIQNKLCIRLHCFVDHNKRNCATLFFD